MSRYQIRVIKYRNVELSPDDLMSISEAAKMLNKNLRTVCTLLDRGDLTEIKDTQPARKGRHLRWCLRREIEDEARIRRTEEA